MCDNGYFGAECNRKCGHCLEADRCHHINGSCLNGCLYGYKGDYCNESLYFFHFSADYKCHINSKIIKLKVVDFFVVFFSILNSYKHYIKRK